MHKLSCCRALVYFIALIADVAIPLAARAAEPASRPPNIIFFLIDDFGSTDLGCCGSDLYETPNIDRLARAGMRFTNAYSACTVCSPTRAALMTGKYPARLHITDWIPGHKRADAKLAIPDWTQYLPRSETTIALVLKKAGYVTCHIGKWHLGNQKQGYPDQHGFDSNIGGTERGQPPSYFSPYKISTLTDGPQGEYLTDREADEALRFIDKHKDKPFFLYVPHHGVHTPLQAKKELVAKFQKRVKPGMRHTNATYAAMIASVDESVGHIVAKLQETGLTDRTIIFFTGDNGGQLRSTSNVPLRAGKGSTYEGGVRVPLVVRWPGITSPGSVCHEPVITVDYFPTMKEMAGVNGQPNAAVDGASITPLLKDAKARLAREAIYWHYPHYHPGGATPYGAVRAGDWKLIEYYEDMRVELFNLKDDQGEKHDQATAQPAKAAQLRSRLHAWRKEAGAQMPTAKR